MLPLSATFGVSGRNTSDERSAGFLEVALEGGLEGDPPSDLAV